MIGRYWASEADLTGTAEALRELAAILTAETTTQFKLYVPPDLSPAPYDSYIGALHVARAGDAVQIELRENTLVVTGSQNKLNILADNIVWLADHASDPGKIEPRLHIGYYPTPAYLPRGLRMKKVGACLTPFVFGLGLAVVLLTGCGELPLEAYAQGSDGYAVYYVAPGGACGGMIPCLSSVQAAVDAVDGTDEVVKIAAGTFTGVSARDGVTQVVYLTKTVTLQGGSSVSDWVNAYPLTQTTILNAGRLGRVLHVGGNVTVTTTGLRLTGGKARMAPRAIPAARARAAVLGVGAATAGASTSLGRA